MVVFVAVVGLASLAAVVYFFRMRQNEDFTVQSSRLEEVLAESEQRGFFITEQDFLQPIPDSENAAIEAMPIILRIDSQKEALAGLRDGPSDPEFATARATYRSLLPEIARLEAALTKPRWQFQRRFGDVYTTFESTRTRTAIAVLCHHAVAQARAGDHAAALRAFASARHLARGVSQDPLVISNLTALVLEGIVLGTAQLLIELWRNDPVRLTEFAEALKASHFTIDLRAAARGELLFAIDFFRNFEARGGFKSLDNFDLDTALKPRSDEVQSGLPTGIRERAYLTRVAAEFNEIDELAAKSDPHDTTWPTTYFDSTKKVDTRKFPSLKALEFYSFAITGMVDGLANRTVTAEMLETLLAVLREPGKSPQLPMDPFNPGKRVQIRREGEKITLWSFGPNRKDNNGAPYNPPSFDRDIIVSCPVVVGRLAR